MNYAIDLKNGNVGVYGGIGNEKAILLQTMLYSLCMKYSPKQLRMHIFDFGGRSLGVFDNMPHILGKAIYSDNENGIREKIKEISLLIEDRKKLFGKYGATSLDAFNRSSDEKLPAVVIVIDNYSVVKDNFIAIDKNGVSLGMRLVKIAREGNSYGIYCIFTGTTSGSISEFITQRVCMRMSDKNAYRDALRLPVNFEISDYLGRGVCVFNKSTVEFQTAFVDGITDDYERSQKIKEKGLIMKSKLDGKADLDMEALTKKMLTFELENIKGGFNLGQTPTGNSINATFEQKNSLIVTSNNEIGLYNYLLAFAKSVMSNADHYYCFDVSRRFENSIADMTEIEKIIFKIDTIDDAEAKIIIIPDFRRFIELISDEAGEKFKELLANKKRKNLFVAIADLTNHMGVLSYFSELKVSAMGVFVGNDIKMQHIFHYSSFPTYDSGLIEKISGLAYDYQADKSEFIM